MAWLNFVISPETIAGSGLKLEQDVINGWNDYKKTFSDKQKLIESLPMRFGEKKNVSRQLIQLIQTDLIDVKVDEENDIISDIKSLKHDDRQRKLVQLEKALAYYQTRYEHVHALLSNLYHILKQQFLLAEKLEDSDLIKYRKFAASLNEEVKLERQIHEQIGNMSTFEKLFYDLVRGEHVIKKLSSDQKRLRTLMKDRMTKIFNKELRDGEAYIWARAVLDALKGRVDKAIADGIVNPYGDPELEFVNRQDFIKLSSDAITAVRENQRPVTQNMLDTFVHYFREWYNSLE